MDRFVWTKRAWCALWAIGFAGFIGCSSDQLPNAPSTIPQDQQAETQLGQPATWRLALKPFALNKPTRGHTDSKTVIKRIGSAGGRLSISNERTLAIFAVPRNALTQPVAISMQILGSGPASVVEFGPDGLQFDRPCFLALSFPSEGVDPAELGGYLIHEDGSTTPVPYKIIANKNRITIIMKVSHFSQYGSDDGEENGTTTDYSYCNEDFCDDDWEPYQPGY